MTTTTIILLLLAAGLIALFVVPAIRRAVISAPIMKIVGRALPAMGDTERIALEAGTVWWDGELFSGKPDWSKLLDFKIKPLSEEEQAFLDG
ncbi:MAG: acyl-CoA dehydrogenase, partial [Proteobacteria bacterium]|nr:acyl-CoA dehydrogenase [Pseudomonadota bacterium]